MLETVFQALQALRANRLRSALTLVGMAIGVFSVIASITAVEVLDGTLMNELAALGTQTITISRMEAEGFPTEEQQKRPQITLAQALALRDRVRTAAAVGLSVSTGSREVRTAEEQTDPSVRVIGADEAYPQNNAREVGAGRFLSDGDVRTARDVVVLGSTVADKLFGDADPLGRPVRVEGMRFTVIGVLAEKSGGLGGGDANNNVVVPITRAVPAFGLQDYDVSIDVRAASAERLATTQDEAVGVFRAVRRLAPEADNDFGVFTSADAAESLKTFTDALATGGAGIGLIALLAAGVGVMNIMLVSVTERTREIGVRKALGATRRAILFQFLVEAVAICVLGGAIGVALAAVVAWGVNQVFTAELSGGTVALAFVICAVVGVAFGLIPAWQAARSSPIEALRYE